MSKHLDDAFDISPNPIDVESENKRMMPRPKVPTAIDDDAQLDSDYKYARENFYNVIERGSDALEEMMHVANSSEHPRAYEVIATIMKTLVDANKDLVAMGRDKIKANNASDDNDKGVTNNNVFVGSTSELQTLLNDMKKD